MSEGTEMRCPYCRAVQYDTWEYGNGADGDHECNCQECGKVFRFNRRTEVWFTTTPLRAKS